MTVTRGGTTLQNLSYAYPATQNNGQIASQTNALSGETVEYQYDQLSRLISAATPGAGGWGLTFTYDGFGNKTNQTVSKGSAPAHSLSINPANNRIAMTGYGYDANGNMTTMPLLTASYDVANRMVETQHSSAGTHRYHYNHANQRVMRYTAAVAGYGGYQRRFSLYGFAGELLLEADWEPGCVSGCPTAAEMETLRNVYFAGRKVFVSAWQGPLKAAVPNRLGSRSEHFPYGEQKGAAPPDGDKDYFTTYRRDETGLDYAWNRYYAPGVGRFTTADPYGGSVRPQVPMSWNRYSYASGNPINRIDVDGLTDYHIDDVANFNPRDPRNVNAAGTSVTVSAGGDGSDYFFFTGTVFSWERRYPTEFSLDDVNRDAERRGAKAAHRMEAPSLCSLLPDGRTVSVTGNIGLLGGQAGAVDVFINYATGEATALTAGGLMAGWNGGGSAGAGSAFVWGTDGNTQNLEGGFSTVSAGYLFGRYLGVGGALTIGFSSGGLNSLSDGDPGSSPFTVVPTSSGSTPIAIGFTGLAGFSGPFGTASATVSSIIGNLGNIGDPGSPASLLSSPLDHALRRLHAACH